MHLDSWLGNVEMVKLKISKCFREFDVHRSLGIDKGNSRNNVLAIEKYSSLGRSGKAPCVRSPVKFRFVRQIEVTSLSQSQ